MPGYTRTTNELLYASYQAATASVPTLTAPAAITGWSGATRKAAADLTGTCGHCATGSTHPHRCPIAIIPVPAPR